VLGDNDSDCGGECDGVWLWCIGDDGGGCGVGNAATKTTKKRTDDVTT